MEARAITMCRFQVPLLALPLLVVAGCGTAPDSGSTEDVCNTAPAGWDCRHVAYPGNFADSLKSVWGSAANDVFVVGYNATIIHSSDQGATWIYQSSPV